MPGVAMMHRQHVRCEMVFRFNGKVELHLRPRVVSIDGLPRSIVLSLFHSDAQKGLGILIPHGGRAMARQLPR